MLKHKHHIIPKHMGGSDDPSNLVELTVEEHAEAHRVLYEQYGRLQDKLAWLGLSGQIGKEEIIKLLLVENGKRRGAANVASGHWASLQSDAGKIGGAVSGKKHVESGHWKEVCKLGGAKVISDRIKDDLEYQKKCFAKLLEKNPNHQSDAGKLGAKKATRKVISLDDGKITTRNQVPAYERKTGKRHNWKEYDENETN